MDGPVNLIVSRPDAEAWCCFHDPSIALSALSLIRILIHMMVTTQCSAMVTLRGLCMDSKPRGIIAFGDIQNGKQVLWKSARSPWPVVRLRRFIVCAATCQDHTPLSGPTPDPRYRQLLVSRTCVVLSTLAGRAARLQVLD
jgi:hypothetical protein